MILPHYLRSLKYQEECTPNTPYPPLQHVKDTILQKSFTLEGFLIALLRVSVVRLTDKQRTISN